MKLKQIWTGPTKRATDVLLVRSTKTIYLRFLFPFRNVNKMEMRKNFFVLLLSRFSSQRVCVFCSITEGRSLAPIVLPPDGDDSFFPRASRPARTLQPNKPCNKKPRPNNSRKQAFYEAMKTSGSIRNRALSPNNMSFFLFLFSLQFFFLCYFYFWLSDRSSGSVFYFLPHFVPIL